MAVKHFCDICQKEVTKYASLDLNAHGLPRHEMDRLDEILDTPIELCDKCLKKMSDWMTDEFRNNKNK